MTDAETIKSLEELRDMSCADDDADSPAQQTIAHAIRAIETLAKVRALLSGFDTPMHSEFGLFVKQYDAETRCKLRKLLEPKP